MQTYRTNSYIIIAFLSILFVYLLVKGIIEVKKGVTNKNTIGFSGVAFFLLLIFITFATPLMLSFVPREKANIPKEKITILVKVDGIPQNRPFNLLIPSHSYPFIFTSYKYESIQSSETLKEDGRLVIVSDFIAAWNNEDLYKDYGILLPGSVIVAEVYVLPVKDSRLRKITPYTVDTMKVVNGYDTELPLEEQSDEVKQQLIPYFP